MYWCQDGKCATRTKARVAWNVVLYCSNLASICSLALILLSPTRWIVMTGWRTSISLQTFVQTRGSLLFASIGLQQCVSKPFELWILVCVHASVSSLVFQTRLDGDSLFVYKHQSPALWFSSPVFKHVQILVPCLCTRTCQQPFVSNTFGCGCLFAYKHQS